MPAFVRVDQIGYDVAEASRQAYLLAPVSAIGATFAVHDASGAVVSSGPVPPEGIRPGVGAAE